MSMITKQIYYTGKVQGVGFRYTVKRIASGYEVTGWVKNLEDGRVEVQATSYDEEELDAFLTGIKESALGGNIKEVETHNIFPPMAVKGFTIAS